jgi:hypothetical protein
MRAEREKLPNRREATTFDVEAGGLHYRATALDGKDEKS